MNERLSKPEYACYVALAASARSEDPYTATGAAVFDKNWRILSTGYNGLQAGMPIPKWMFEESNRSRKSNLMIHAEKNAFSRITGDAYAVGITMTPCPSCLDVMIAHNIKEIYYIDKYKRSTEDADILIQDKIKMYNIIYRQLSADSLRKLAKIMFSQYVSLLSTLDQIDKNTEPNNDDTIMHKSYSISADDLDIRVS